MQMYGGLSGIPMGMNDNRLVFQGVQVRQPFGLQSGSRLPFEVQPVIPVKLK